MDKKGTFHGMGIFASSTPSDNSLQSHEIKRLQNRRLVTEVVFNKGVSIFPFIGPSKLTSFLKLKPFKMLNALDIFLSDLSYELLWHSGCLLSSQSRPRSNWSGFMQQVFRKPNSSDSQSDVFLLPIINMWPTDLTCIYSTLLLIQSQANKLNIDTHCITSDQP